MRILIGTTSKIKLDAIETMLHTYAKRGKLDFAIIAQDVESQVPDTPYGNETIMGARNRSSALLKNFFTRAELFVGLESGLVERYGNIYEECWCVIKDKNGNDFLGYSSGFMVPKTVIAQMTLGKSHREVLKNLAVDMNIDSKDTWLIYSKGILSRTASIKEAFRNSLLTLEYFLQ
jgi:non-canonical (house-cleaning) NTP pyrophosphatase